VKPVSIEEKRKLRFTRLYESPTACKFCGVLVTRLDKETAEWKTDYPQQLYINADQTAPRDEYGNLEPAQIHYCDPKILASLSDEKKIAWAQQQQKTLIGIISGLAHELKKLREEAVIKQYVVERRTHTTYESP
jgi:hypothetical protein